MPLKIIGTGFGRTGSTSIKKVLNNLGIKVYHMDELYANYFDYKDFCEAFEAKIENDKVKLLKILKEKMDPFDVCLDQNP